MLTVIEGLRSRIKQSAEVHRFRSTLYDFYESRFWEKGERISTIYNPVAMVNLEVLRLKALVGGEIDFSNLFSSQLWAHQFELTTEQLESIDQLGTVVGDSNLNREARFAAARSLYAVIKHSKHVDAGFNPESAARARIWFEVNRDSDEPFGRDGLVAHYLSGAFSTIYGVSKYDLIQPARKFEEAHRIMSTFWELPPDKNEYRAAWGSVRDGLEQYYVGLHDLVAQRRGLLSWEELTRAS